MAIGHGQGSEAAAQAARSALANPLFDAPLEGASGVLLNVTGGPDLTLGQVHEVADIVHEAADSGANVIFGVVQERGMKGRVSVTLVGTGIEGREEPVIGQAVEVIKKKRKPSAPASTSFANNGHSQAALVRTRPLL